MTNVRPLFLLSIAAVGGCIDAPSWAGFPKPTTSATGADASSSSGGEAPHATESDGIMTTTIDVEPTTTTGDTTSTTSTTTGPPLEPAIVGQVLGPDPLMLAGPIAVSIATEHADGVRMQVDDAAPVELAALGPDTHAGEILMLSSLSNGTHAATFTAWRDDLESSPLEITFDVALPEAGQEAFWESGPLIGKGMIAALAVTPEGEVIEFGTYYPMNQARCYLRRRDLGGAWGGDDFVVVLPDTMCTAVDMKVSPAGEIFTLARRMDNGDVRWTLGKQARWGDALENVGQGAIDEDAQALAIHPEMVAVCGARPQPTDDLDALVAIFRPKMPGVVEAFDYEKPGVVPHKFSETARDCVFVGDDLVLVGEVWGRHEENSNETRDRLFALELAASTLEATWTVAAAGPGTQSRGTAAALDEQGRVYIAGHTCDDSCVPEGVLRTFIPGEGLTAFVPLGLDVRSPHDIAWHPAGYVVLAGTREDSPNSTVFWTQAWIPGAGQPFWTAQHSDAPTLQIAMTLAIGTYGQVFVGGVGALGYPAIAYLNG